METMIDERTWIDRAKQGDQAAFEAIVQRYERQIYTFIFRMMGDADDAHDLTQDSFLKAYRALGRTSDDLKLSAWLHRIASNACLDVLRRRQRVRWLPWDDPKHDHLLSGSPVDEPERAALSQETRTCVQRVLDRMTPRHRAALLLREYEGLSCAEVGQVLRLSRSAARSTLYRARCEFRALYERATTTPAAAAAGQQ